MFCMNEKKQKSFYDLIMKNYEKILEYTEMAVKFMFLSNITHLNVTIDNFGNVDITPYDEKENVYTVFSLDMSEEEKKDILSEELDRQTMLASGFKEEEIEGFYNFINEQFINEQKLLPFNIDSLRMYNEHLYYTFFKYITDRIYDYNFSVDFEEWLNEILNELEEA